MSVLSQFVCSSGSGGSSGIDLVPCELLIVGAGGRGGGSAVSNRAGGGGGAGRLLYGHEGLIKGVTYPIIIGSSGNSSSLGAHVAGAGAEGDGGLTQNSAPRYGGSLFGGSGGGESSGNSSTTRGAGGGGGALEPGLGWDWIARLGWEQLAYSSTSITSSGVWTSYAHTGGSVSNTNSGKAGGKGMLIGIETDFPNINTHTYAAGGAGANSNSGTNITGANGANNTGNGGGGSQKFSGVSIFGGLGGSGVVIIAYRNNYPAPTSITGTYSQPSRTGYRVYKFTGSGSITL